MHYVILDWIHKGHFCVNGQNWNYINARFAELSNSTLDHVFVLWKYTLSIRGKGLYLRSLHYNDSG